ncbi:MAG TPA: hypothetical protein VIM18_01630 [Solirubrobacteraceae bacterium]
MARFAGVAAGAVRSAAAVGNNAQPECRFVAGRLRVVVNVDGSPQAYQRLERTIVEDGQQFGTVRSFAAPIAVPGLGLDAAWVPDQSSLITTDGRRLISVRVSWAARGAPRRALAQALARRYLGP